jgi:hypothetical protein
MSQFKQNNRAEWIGIQQRVYGTNPAPTQQWTRPEEILRALSPFCACDRNHMFFPDGGGLDLEAVFSSHEPGCLDLMTGGVPNVVRPARLLFESFPDYASLSYFRLETAQLESSGVYENLTSGYEEVVELSPRNYIERWTWDAGFYDHDESGREIPLPESARLAVRWFTGAFVVFAKGSIYNSISATYDARHNKMSAPEFRTYIERMIAHAKERGIPE